MREEGGTPLLTPTSDAVQIEVEWTVIWYPCPRVAFVSERARYIKYRFFEPPTPIHCPQGSTDERCVRVRKIMEASQPVKADEPSDQTLSESR